MIFMPLRKTKAFSQQGLDRRLWMKSIGGAEKSPLNQG
jgi:hypothetical protein